MYTIFNTLEKIMRGFKIYLKMFYYKLKYGRRLKIGKGVHFRKGFIINISKNGKVEIGDNTFFNNYCSINCHDKITIGKNNLFGEGVKIYDHNHIFNDKSVNMKKAYKTHPVEIGNRNWFGSNIVILSKAKIGNNNVFAANIVINSELKSNYLVKQKTSMDVERIDYR